MITISPELKPVLDQLKAEGYKVYTYKTDRDPGNSLFWYENGRVLSIQPSTWRHAKYSPDRYNLYAHHTPNRKTGSGCILTDIESGTSAQSILSYRCRPNWTKKPVNYSSIEEYISKSTLIFYEL